MRPASLRSYTIKSASTSSPIQTVTVGPGITPGQLPLARTKALADSTAGGDFHPALKTSYFVVQFHYTAFCKKCNPFFGLPP